MPSNDTTELWIVRSQADNRREVADRVVVEEPLQIRIAGQSAFVTMRTPGDDLDLAAGFLLTEGWISDAGEIGTMAYCADEKDPELRNIIAVTLLNDAVPDPAATRSWANSSCGICGKATLESIRQDSSPILDEIEVSSGVICGLPDALRQRQSNFERTGGIHAAGLFDREGRCLAVREDIGRHNATDKVIGASLREGSLGRAALLVVSGRLGFEIAQKSLMARVPIVASVSAPSSLAVELAQEFGMTAIGFLRGDTMNIYSHPERIA